MTDLNMDADCVHGVTWWECLKCNEWDSFAQAWLLGSGVDIAKATDADWKRAYEVTRGMVS